MREASLMAIDKELSAAIPSKIYALNCMSVISDNIPHQYFRFISCSLYVVHSQKSHQGCGTKKSERIVHQQERHDMSLL